MKKIIEEFTPQGGAHCITNALKQLFTYHGYPMTEAMMFGVASGLSFLYLNQSNAPMISGRTQIFAFEKMLAKRLHMSIKCKTTKEYELALCKTKQLIDQNQPVLVYVDMPYLSYLEMDKNSHFGGHAIVLFGYDDDTRMFMVSDRDQSDAPIRIPSGQLHCDYHLVSYDEMQTARSSNHRPFPANNKYLILDFDGFQPVNRSVLQEAIKDTCQSMLYPPAKLLGVEGILKFSKEILKWKKFTPNKVRLAAMTNYFQISKDGGTGGGIFRKLYGEFLIEASDVLQDQRFVSFGKTCIELANAWDEIADDLWKFSKSGDLTSLDAISSTIMQLYHREKELYEALLSVIEENTSNT